MLREEAIEMWVIPALKNTWNEKRCNEVLEAIEQEPCTVTGFADRCMECGKILGDMIKDAVSREEVMSMLHNHAFDYATSTKISALLKTMRGEVDRMPSAHLECTEDYCPAAFKPVECEDCVSRDAVLEALYDHEYKKDIRKDIEALPSVQPKQRTGYWIFKSFDSDTGISNTRWCSECDKPFVGIYKNYCSNCGSFNGGEQDGSTSGTENP